MRPGNQVLHSWMPSGLKVLCSFALLWSLQTLNTHLSSSLVILVKKLRLREGKGCQPAGEWGGLEQGQA